MKGSYLLASGFDIVNFFCWTFAFLSAMIESRLLRTMDFRLFLLVSVAGTTLTYTTTLTIAQALAVKGSSPYY